MDTYFKQENEDELCVKLPGVPEEMWADGVDPKESWKKWKLIHSTVSEEDMVLCQDLVQNKMRGSAS